MGPKIQDFAGVLKIDIGQCPNFAGIVASGCEELVKLSVETTRAAHQVLSGDRLRAGGLSASPIEKTQHLGKKRPSGVFTTVSAGPGAAAKDHGLAPFTIECLDKLPPGGCFLNGYEVPDILGRGAMGVVFKAFDPSLERYAAIKMLVPERLVSSEARERFQREARTAAAVQHPNIVTIYAVSEFNSLPYLAMEYITGTSLQDRLDQEGPLPLAEVVSLVRQIAAGLNAAHSRGVVHRDIKPANILVQKSSGLVKISDFGLARLEKESEISSDGAWVGTPLYMAPEQFNAGPLDHRADLFSFGGLLYALCTGRTPFLGDTVLSLMRAVCEKRPASLRSLRPEAPFWLENLVNKLLEKIPMNRFQSAEEVEKFIDRFANLQRLDRRN